MIREKNGSRGRFFRIRHRACGDAGAWTKEPTRARSAHAACTPATDIKWGARVSGITTAKLLDRIAGGVPGHLVRECLGKVNVHPVCEGEQVGKDVRRFLADQTHGVGVSSYFVQLVAAPPLEVFHQLRRFDGDGHGEILWIVKLLPLPLGDKALDQRLEFRHRGATIRHARNSCLRHGNGPCGRRNPAPPLPNPSAGRRDRSVVRPVVLPTSPYSTTSSNPCGAGEALIFQVAEFLVVVKVVIIVGKEFVVFVLFVVIFIFLIVVEEVIVVIVPIVVIIPIRAGGIQTRKQL